MKFKLLLPFLFISIFSFAQQIPEDVKPPSWQYKSLSTPRAFKLPSFNLQALIDEDKVNDTNKSIPWRFGHQLYVGHNFNSVGEWTTLENGDRIWRMAYTSEGALTLNFMFDVFNIPEGAKLYVYNSDKTDLLRPFSHYNNNEENVLGTWMVEGNEAIVEYYQPANVTGTASIVVGSVVHGYRTAKSYQKALGDSGDCNQDVDCDISPTTDPYSLNTVKENVKKAAGMLVTGGSGFCSGTLVNNTNNDGTPYFITANHCSGGEGSWAFRFNWRSGTPSCSTTASSPNNSYDQTVSGSTLRANSSQSDMELVEITDTSFFNNNPDVVWAGWNNSTTQTPVVNFGIHHPSGDIQKTCRDDDGATRNTVNFNGNANTQMWYITEWELGVTEQGSSGSGLFNESGELIGMLSGGAAACNGTSNNGQYDFYGRFGVAWDYGTTSATRLKDWLDPANTGVTSIGQYPALQTYDNDATVGTGTNNSLQCGEDFTPQVTISNPGNLALTSATVEYYIDSDTSTVLNWTGNIASGSSLVVATPTYSNLASGSHTFVVNISNPNGVSDENTSNDTSAFNFDVAESYTTSTITVDITIDNYGYETTWSLTDSSGTVVSSSPTSGYAANSTTQEIITLPTLNECYTFTISDAYGDGICCTYGNGSYSLTDENGILINTGGDFGSGESVTFKVEDALSVNQFDMESLISVYPNPINDIINVELTNLNTEVNYSIFNTLGQEIVKGELDSNVVNQINVSSYQSGVYFVKLSSGTNTVTKKIIKN
ncbi:T9SS type A sorting domain-containing protein [Winogradskyella endarachnes]|uniref:T9SS type A sorting domain-containing protein n=1 Tax=Winogradskyella endarachnes TaxID=2681965 RepID=A0A6L6U816_9FLAO|nr:T9SS type A sorting domain-containing protein [Winogradskyella endarachnes]MUU77027.1 T9SS type A sorting domain-containing protein [Winogradskyella endarachnes]